MRAIPGFAALVGALLVTSALPLAAAQDPSDAPSDEALAGGDDEAREHFQAGTSLFQVGDYAAALREYEQAYALSERPELLYNLFLCHERLGQLEDAVRTLDRFLAERPDLEERDVLEARLENLRRRLEASRAPPPEEPTPDEPPPPEPRVAPAPPEPGGPSISTAALATLIAGGALAIAWGATAIGAFAVDQDLAGRCGMTCPRSETDPLFALGVTADVLLGVSVVTLATGLILALTTSDGPSEERARLGVAPWVDPRGAGLALAGALD